MNASTLSRLYRGLEALYQTDTGIDPTDVLLPFESTGSTRELLLLRESGDGTLEVGLALDHGALRRLESSPVEFSLGDEGLGETLPILEGLSHLMYVAEAARRDRPISGLELETQAEVDKLAICLLHRWPRARDHFERLVDRLYYRFELEPIDESLRERYELANRVALGFTRRLKPHVDTGHLRGLRDALRRFWHASMTDKQSMSR